MLVRFCRRVGRDGRGCHRYSSSSRSTRCCPSAASLWLSWLLLLPPACLAIARHLPVA